MAVGLLSFILQGEKEDVRLGVEQNPPGSTAGGLGAEEGINQSVYHSQSVNQKSIKVDNSQKQQGSISTH